MPFIQSNVSPALTIKNFDDRAGGIESDWSLVARGTRTKTDVWTDYLDNLRLVLNDLAILLNNFEAKKVVVTSDHGNAIGEHGIFGHPGGVSIPELYEVPWVETNAIDTGEYSPSEYDNTARSGSVEERLESLGYGEL